METPSKSSTGAPRMALGALDANSHLNSPRGHTTPGKVSSPMHKSNSGFVTPVKGLYSLKDSFTPAPAKQTIHPTPSRGIHNTSVTPSKSSEKRKIPPTSTSTFTTSLDAERAVKHARLTQPSQGHNRHDSGHSLGPSHSRKSSASAVGHGHKLFGEIATRVEHEEDMDSRSSQDTIANSSFNDEEMGDASHLLSVPVVEISLDAAARRGLPGSPEDLRQNAQALKLRLQFAMYKLQTHQEHVPLRHVRVVPTKQRFPGVVGSPVLSTGGSPVRSPPAPNEQVRGAYVEGAGVGHSRTPFAGEKMTYGEVQRGGHSRTPSADKSRAPQQTSQSQAPVEAAADDTEDEQNPTEKGRDTISPTQESSQDVRDEGRDRIAAPDYGERQDRLLSLANAVEQASQERGRGEF